MKIQHLSPQDIRSISSQWLALNKKLHFKIQYQKLEEKCLLFLNTVSTIGEITYAQFGFHIALLEAKFLYSLVKVKFTYTAHKSQQTS